MTKKGDIGQGCKREKERERERESKQMHEGQRRRRGRGLWGKDWAEKEA